MNELASFRAALVVRIVAGLGVGSALVIAACGGDAQQGAGGGGLNDGAGGAGGASGSSSVGSTSSSSSSAASTTSSSSSSSSSSSGAVMTDVERCFAIAAGMACPDIAGATTAFGACTSTNEPIVKWLSGPTVVGTDCCYQVDVGAPNDPPCGAIPGRPFVVEGRARVAPVGSGVRGWAGRSSEPSTPPRSEALLSPGLVDLDGATRARLGREWAHDGSFEHASVASFGKLALELLAFGAPADLVRAAHEAALDEVRHASMCFRLASAYLGSPIGPGALPEASSFKGAATLAELAASAVREGCLGETLAAVVASAQRAAATDPAAREVLTIVAEEESRHAELAFRVVAWAITRGGKEVRSAVQEAFADGLDEVRRAAAAGRGGPASPDVIRAHGRLSIAEVAAERLRAAEEVTAPAMRQLLAAV